MDTKYDYTFKSSDPEGLHIWYYIDWGDGKDTGWIGPYNSDIEISRSHKWTEQGTYTVRCKCKDVYDDESSWGELTIEIPRTRASSYLWLDWLMDKYPLLEVIISRILAL